MRAAATRLFGPSGTPRVAIVGAGFGGIGAGVKLKKAGIDTFTIYESSLGVGGTWWDNTYPRAEVDVNSNLYCYSFKSHRWTRTHAGQVELQTYLEDTVDEFGLRPHLRLGVTVRAATWDNERHVWKVAVDTGSLVEFHAVISAVGFLNVPRYPDWPGLEDFEGPHFHTARWEHHHDLSDKTVAVVGSGSTATQVVPAIQPTVKKLYVFQREPGWVSPKYERDLSDEERALFATAWRRAADRSRLRWLIEKSLWGGAMFRPGTKLHGRRQQACLDYIAREFADRPDLREGVTPRYPFPGKRPIMATTYYPALKEANVELVPRAVSRLTPTGVVDAEGVERAVDVVVMATGFRAADYLNRLRIVGRDGLTLQEHWSGEPRAYLGITVPRFPNFFMLYGPGTNGGELVSMLEAQADYAVRALKRMRRERLSAIEVRPSFEALWHKWMESKMKGTSWTMSTNYFKSETGKVVTQWPSGNLVYGVLTKMLGRISETSLGVPAVSGALSDRDDDGQEAARPMAVVPS
ncbi:MAG TPA: NAD(P)/FAD-dependent oxidoreductase [Acidimicrobiales bacterium]|nr:NAD(P)/FAD-dependent oxidoreductase [Acidimicrobiales bacterium]